LSEKKSAAASRRSGFADRSREIVNKSHLDPEKSHALWLTLKAAPPAPDRWSAEDLANHCRRAELMPGATSLPRVNDHVIRQALEKAGVEFVDENGGCPGRAAFAPPSAEADNVAPI
jgi:hypothetical protein